MTRLTFDEVGQRRRVQFPCTVCGKVLKRVIYVYQTINPYNRTLNSQGLVRPKLEAEIRAELPAMPRCGCDCWLCTTGVHCPQCWLDMGRLWRWIRRKK